MGHHLFLNIIPINFTARTERKVWCDQGIKLTSDCPMLVIYLFIYLTSIIKLRNKACRSSPGKLWVSFLVFGPNMCKSSSLDLPKYSDITHVTFPTLQTLSLSPTVMWEKAFQMLPFEILTRSSSKSSAHNLFLSDPSLINPPRSNDVYFFVYFLKIETTRDIGMFILFQNLS